MTLLSNPEVKAALDNLQIQFGNKALLTLDDYSALFSIKRENAAKHARRNEVPREPGIGQDVYFPILELALFLARKKAAREGRIIVVSQSEEAKKSRGFAKKAHDAQLAGRHL